MARGKAPSPIKDRILNRILKNKDCWEWQGRITYQGYGQVSVGSRTDNSRRNRQAHIVSYECFISPVPKGLTLDHLCRNRKCVNPSHLEPVTIQENIARGAVAQWQRDKTHCPQGHEYTPENIYKGSRGSNHRNCKTCMKARTKARYWAKRRITPSLAH